MIPFLRPYKSPGELEMNIDLPWLLGPRRLGSRLPPEPKEKNPKKAAQKAQRAARRKNRG